jgi:DNA-binding transcriptional ArsR family regulator
VKTKEVRDVSKQFFKINTPVARMGLGMRAMSVYMALASYIFDQDRTQQCHPSIYTLAQDMGVNRRTVERGLDELKNAGLISVQRRGTVTRKMSSIYTLLHVEPVAALVVHSGSIGSAFQSQPDEETVAHSSPAVVHSGSIGSAFQSDGQRIPVTVVAHSGSASSANESHKEEYYQECYQECYQEIETEALPSNEIAESVSDDGFLAPPLTPSAGGVAGNAVVVHGLAEEVVVHGLAEEVVVHGLAEEVVVHGLAEEVVAERVPVAENNYTAPYGHPTGVGSRNSPPGVEEDEDRTHWSRERWEELWDEIAREVAAQEAAETAEPALEAETALEAEPVRRFLPPPRGWGVVRRVKVGA